MSNSNISQRPSITINQFIQMRTEYEKGEKLKNDLINDALNLVGVKRTVPDQTDYIILQSKLNNL